MKEIDLQNQYMLRCGFAKDVRISPFWLIGPRS